MLEHLDWVTADEEEGFVICYILDIMNEYIMQDRMYRSFGNVKNTRDYNKVYRRKCRRFGHVKIIYPAFCDIDAKGHLVSGTFK